MRNLILTLGIGEQGRQFHELSLPLMQDYARRIGADCHAITTAAQSDPLMLHLEKFRIRDLFKRYRRILYLDADVIVMPGAPNIFREIRPTRFAAWPESSLLTQRDWIKTIQQKLGIIPDWQETFFNAGIFLASRHHAPLFAAISPAMARRVPTENPLGRYSDQSYLNWKLAHTSVPTQPLSVFWNWSPICGYIHPAAHFVHFLGTGFFEPARDRLLPPQDPVAKRLRQMQELIGSFSTGIKPAEPVLDLCVTSPGVRSCVPLPHYILPRGAYEVEMLLHPPGGESSEPIHCTLFGKMQENAIVAEWTWRAEELAVTRSFSTEGLEYPQFCFDSATQAKRVSALRIRWCGRREQRRGFALLNGGFRDLQSRLRRRLGCMIRPRNPLACPHDTVS